MFTASASMIAQKASDNAVKYGGLASQKVFEMANNVNEKVRSLYLIHSSLSTYTFCYTRITVPNFAQGKYTQLSLHGSNQIYVHI